MNQAVPERALFLKLL